MVFMMLLEETRRGQRSDQRALIVWIAGLLAGCMHQLLFYGKDWGVSYPLFVLLFYVYFYGAIRERHELRFGGELMLLLPIALLSLTYAAFTNILFGVLNALAVPCLILLHTTWTVRRKELRWFEPAVLVALLEQLFVHSLRYVPLPVQTLARLLSGKWKIGRSHQAWKVLAGIVISLPILLLVGSLLASADAIFQKTVSKLPQWLGEMELGTLLFRILWIAAVGTGMFVYVWGLLYPKRKQAMKENGAANEAEPRRAFGPPHTADAAGTYNPAAWEAGAVNGGSPSSLRLDPVIMTTVLIMLNAVYVLFTVVQFSYLFGSGEGMLPDGVTYAEYARRGFAELIVVTVINLTVLMMTLYGVARPAYASVTAKRQAAAKTAPAGSPAAPDGLSFRLVAPLLTLLIGCTGVMLCSAHLRLSLYEMAYGFTMARVLVHAFMFYLLILFGIAFIKLWKEKLPLLKLYVITSITAYVLMNYIQIDAIVAGSNLRRFEETGKLDITYLQSLSWEAVPYLIRLKQEHPELTGTDKALHAMKLRIDHQKHRSWTEFNVSEWRASKALQQALAAD